MDIWLYITFSFCLFVFYLCRGGGSEPAGLRGLRKQVTEIGEGPLELRREEKKVVPEGRRGRKGGKKVWCRHGVREGERESASELSHIFFTHFS